MKINRHHPSRKFAPGPQLICGVGLAWCALSLFAAAALGLSLTWLLVNAPVH